MNIVIDHSSTTPKYQQLVNNIIQGIAKDIYHIGDQLPSVNQLCKTQNLSRDTVFKAYTLLKDQGVIAAVANKGYYIANETRKVFLLLDTFKAYKEVLYDAFIKNLAPNIIVDVHFHHYNIEIFRTLINEGLHRYSKFIVMPFDHNNIRDILSPIPKEKLLAIDWDIHTAADQNKLYQDFGLSLYNCLEQSLPLLKKYKEFHFIYPQYTHHPITAVTNFKKFCTAYQIPFEIIKDPESFKIKKHTAYLSVSDRMLGRFLEQSGKQGMEPGKDVGIISYNETPMKKFIYKGITVISTDFEALGKNAAEFVTSNTSMNLHIPTKLILRHSI